MHLEDVLLAGACLDEAVVAVRTDVWLLAGVDLHSVHQSSPKPILSETNLDSPRLAFAFSTKLN